MKKTVLLIALLVSISLHSQTLIVADNFDYSTGILTTVSANWTESPTGSVDIQAISGNLSFTNYFSSGIGNKIALDGGADRSGVIHSFTSQSLIGSSVYFSFLLNVTSTTDMGLNDSNGDYFFNFQNSSLSILRGYVYVRQGSNSTKYSIGLAKSSSASLTWYSTELDVGSTYLVVVGYSFISGSNNDDVKLWLNPDLSGSEPLANIDISSGADAADLGHIQFRQRSLSGDMDIDGLRLSDDWSLAPLPVELTSFSAIIIDSKIKLNWRTEIEVNNYGFDILRQAQNESWVTIGFVEGYGNSNSPKEYSFIDENVVGGNYFYRLKQIDNDGTVEYSKVIEVDMDTPIGFELSQNYPNPFNPETSIKFTTPKAGFVKLSYYNILGELKGFLVNEFKDAGIHTVNLDASELNSGIYVYKLEIDNFVQMRKMNLIK